MKQFFKLTTLSPLHIGSGAAMSPYSDFVYRNGRLYYIDTEKFAARLPDDKIDIFVSKIQSSLVSRDNRNKFTLADFVNSEGIDLDDISMYSVDCYNIGRAREIQKLVSTAGRAFIPGSSIKGSIRTALLYDYFKNDDKGKGDLGMFIDGLKNVSPEFEKYKENILSSEGKISELEDKIKNERDYKVKRRLQDDQKACGWKIKDILKPIRVKLENEFRNIESYLFGSVINKDFMKYIRVSDSNAYMREKVVYIDALNRIKLSRPDNKGTPVLSELLKEDTPFKFSIHLDPALDEISNSSYFKKLDFDFMLRALRDFSLDQLAFETKNLPRQKEMEKIKKRYDELTGMIAKQNKTLVRLGGKRSFFYFTIMSLIPEKEFEVFREIYRIGEHPQKKIMVRGRFPSTKFFLLDNEFISDLAGWCTLEKSGDFYVPDKLKESDKPDKDFGGDEKSEDEDIFSKLSQKFVVTKEK